MVLFTSGLAAAAGLNFGAGAMASLHEDSEWPLQSYEITRVVLPSFGDPSTRTNALPGNPGYSASGTQSVAVTGWLKTREPYGKFGLSLGVNAPTAPAGSPGADATMPASMDLGVRWRSQRETGPQLDVFAWARTPQLVPTTTAMALIRDEQQVQYGTRVEVQWESSKTRGWAPEFGAVGLQLEGGSRLLLRARKGGPMLYYRSKF